MTVSCTKAYVDGGTGRPAAVSALTSLQVTSVLSYVIAILIPALDTVFPVLPSETTIIALGVATAGGTDPRIALVVACCATGAFLGDNLSYLLGRREGVRGSALGRDEGRGGHQMEHGVHHVHAASLRGRAHHGPFGTKMRRVRKRAVRIFRYGKSRNNYFPFRMCGRPARAVRGDLVTSRPWTDCGPVTCDVRISQ
jgi:hypothetical protein